MLLIIAAASAVAAALAEFTLGPYLTINGAVPHFVLVFGVIWTILGGLEGGFVWAFVGGLALDVIVQRPIGSSAFALLLAVGAAAVIGGAFGRLRIAAPVVAVLAGSLIYSMLLLVTSTALLGPVGIADPVGTFLPGAVLDTMLAALVGPLAVAVQQKRRDAERVEW